MPIRSEFPNGRKKFVAMKISQSLPFFPNDNRLIPISLTPRICDTMGFASSG